jgi:hypothetical protein
MNKPIKIAIPLTSVSSEVFNWNKQHQEMTSSSQPQNQEQSLQLNIDREMNLIQSQSLCPQKYVAAYLCLFGYEINPRGIKKDGRVFEHKAVLIEDMYSAVLDYDLDKSTLSHAAIKRALGTCLMRSDMAYKLEISQWTFTAPTSKEYAEWQKFQTLLQFTDHEIIVLKTWFYRCKHVARHREYLQIQDICPVLISAIEGTGKSTIIRAIIKAIDELGCSFIELQLEQIAEKFSASVVTNTGIFLDDLDKIDKKYKGTLWSLMTAEKKTARTINTDVIEDHARLASFIATSNKVTAEIFEDHNKRNRRFYDIQLRVDAQAIDVTSKINWEQLWLEIDLDDIPDIEKGDNLKIIQANQDKQRSRSYFEYFIEDYFQTIIDQNLKFIGNDELSKAYNCWSMERSVIDRTDGPELGHKMKSQWPKVFAAGRKNSGRGVKVCLAEAQIALNELIEDFGGTGS